MDIISTIADVLLSCSRSKKNRTAERPAANAPEPPTTNTSSSSPSSSSNTNSTTTTSLEPSLPSSASLLSSLFPTLSQSPGPSGGSSDQATSSASAGESAHSKKSKLDVERILRILQAGQTPSTSSASSDPSASLLQQLPPELLAGGPEGEENPLGSFLTKDAIRMLMPTLQEVNHKFNVEKQLHALNATAAMAKIMPKTLPPGTDTTEEDELEEDLLDEEEEDTIEYKFTPRPVFIATICQVCKNPLKSFVHCERCKMVSYCGEEHRRTDQPAHRELCAVLCEVAGNRGGHIYQLARKLNVPEYRNLRVHTLNQIELTLKRPMQAYEREIVLFPRICLTPECREWRQELLTECTDCRQQTGLPFGSTFTIHLVGAELQFEGDTLDKWEAFFLHLVPEVAVLRVVFVGPELNVENLPIDVISRIRMCRTCRLKCRVVAFDFQCRTMYHDYRHSSRYQRPNLICFFNPGLHRTTGFAGQDSWPVTIRAATEAGCPMLVTAYTELESPLDLDRLQRESTRALQVVQPPTVNPYGSKRPDRNFISDDTAPMIFKNYYYFIVK
uniref:MYND-type domain-containing protein n=1 Tax=Anopheles coluzzii TaxID=1518534 RepID=A0A8W7PHE9_ANOCL